MAGGFEQISGKFAGNGIASRMAVSGVGNDTAIITRQRGTANRKTP
jgi:hypothetical protein